MADHIVIIGGGPGGYEAAHVAAQLGAEVTVVDTDGIGGSAVLTDCVPSKTLIATAELMTDMGDRAGARGQLPRPRGRRGDLHRRRPRSGQRAGQEARGRPVDRHRGPPRPRRRTRREGSRPPRAGPHRGGRAARRSGPTRSSSPPAPRRARCPSAQPDGERILTWEQVYDLTEVPEKLIVVGSGVTGAEFASAYLSLGIDVTLVSSRDRVLPGEDADASAVLEDVLTRRGMHVLGQSRMQSVTRDGDDGHRDPDRRPHGHRAATASSRSARSPTPPTSASRRPASPPTTAASSPSTGSRAPRRAASTPPATAPAC